MNSPHTPGPWLAIPTTAHGRNPDTKRMDIVSTSGEWNPAFVAGDILPDDARLIASAPDLLRALEKLLSTRHDPMGLEAANAYRQAHEVISKAKGQN